MRLWIRLTTEAALRSPIDRRISEYGSRWPSACPCGEYVGRNVARITRSKTFLIAVVAIALIESVRKMNFLRSCKLHDVRDIVESQHIGHDIRIPI